MEELELRFAVTKASYRMRFLGICDRPAKSAHQATLQKHHHICAWNRRNTERDFSFKNSSKL